MQLKDDKLAELEDEYHALIGMSGLVKEWKDPKRPEDRGSYWFSPANHLDWKRRFVRNPGIWIHHLYSKIRGHSSGGNGSASSFANTADVPGANVLVRTRHFGGGTTTVAVPAVPAVLRLQANCDYRATAY